MAHTNGAAIRALRESRGYKLYELATQAEITDGYLSNIELGRRSAPPWVARRLADALKVPLTAILASPDDDGEAA